jgi:AcrR family transcriptional regulator
LKEKLNPIDGETTDSTKTISRRERRSIETRERIFRTALDLFAERGFNATTVEAIAGGADIGKGTFFNYFDNKESILLQYGEMQLMKVGMFIAESLNSDESLRSLIHTLAVTIIAEQQHSPALSQSLFTAVFSNEGMRLKMAENIHRGRRLLAKLLKKRQQSGEVRSDLPALEIARLFQVNILGTMMLCSLAPDSITKEKIGNMVSAFVEGIQAPPEICP